MKAKYYTLHGLDKAEIECDSIELVLDDGQRFELAFHKGSGAVKIYAGGKLVVLPQAANVIQLQDLK
jgi:hypothetical protein